MNRDVFVEYWTKYRDSRVGDYAFRSRTRYAAVYARLIAMGLKDHHTVLDAGAGTGQFGDFLKSCGWKGRYLPVDAVIPPHDDLETWNPPFPGPEFAVCIEVVEHLRQPYCHHLLYKLVSCARVGVVVTTPNSETVDVIACDPTHVSVVTASEFERDGFSVTRHSWFNKRNDSLLAWYYKGHR